MNLQNNISFGLRRIAARLAVFLALIFVATVQILAQTRVRVPPAVQPDEDYTWWYGTLLLLGLALAAAVMWMIKSKKEEKAALSNNFRKEKMMSENNAWDATSLDMDREMEWYRRHKKSVGKSNPKMPKRNLAENLPKTDKIFNRVAETEDGVLEFSESEFRQRQIGKLPIFKFQKLELARPFAPLSISSDDDLMTAIEQAHDEFEEDEEIRDLAVRILTRFKTRNSVEALSQVALYDLSSNLRSKAVSVLADFDHESVFETILLACADPTREVRAAAARGLFRLSFDRADAWTRIAETGDEFRMRQAVLAAKEADLVKRSFDRLIHQDRRIAYEAVALLALMVRAGETGEIIKAIETHHDESVKLALLHVIGLTKSEETLPYLCELVEKPAVSDELKKKINEVIESFELIPA